MSAHACMGSMVHHSKRMLDEVEEMEEVSDALQDWLDMHRPESDRECVVANCLGASREPEALHRHLSAGGIKGRPQVD
eukprot:3094080-Rhodomonas_salina.1